MTPPIVPLPAIKPAATLEALETLDCTAAVKAAAPACPDGDGAAVMVMVLDPEPLKLTTVTVGKLATKPEEELPGTWDETGAPELLDETGEEEDEEDVGASALDLLGGTRDEDELDGGTETDADEDGEAEAELEID